MTLVRKSQGAKRAVTDFDGLDNGVKFILIGGVAATGHGSARFTSDLDVVYERSDDNIKRVAEALAAHRPYMRGAPPGLPFEFDERTIRGGLNFTLDTDLGDLDLLGEVTGGGRYEDLLGEAMELAPFGRPVLALSLEQLIRTKRAAGRPKDLEALAELEALLEARDELE